MNNSRLLMGFFLVSSGGSVSGGIHRGQLFFDCFGVFSLCERFAEQYVEMHGYKLEHEQAGYRLLDSVIRWYARLVHFLEQAMSTHDLDELVVARALNDRAVTLLVVCFSTDAPCVGARTVLSLAAEVIEQAIQDRSKR